MVSIHFVLASKSSKYAYFLQRYHKTYAWLLEYLTFMGYMPFAGRGGVGPMQPVALSLMPPGVSCQPWVEPHAMATSATPPLTAVGNVADSPRSSELLGCLLLPANQLISGKQQQQRLPFQRDVAQLKQTQQQPYSNPVIDVVTLHVGFTPLPTSQ